MSLQKQLLLSAGAIFGAYATVSSIMARSLTTTKRLPILDTPDAVGLQYQDVSFKSRDDHVNLSGWIITPSDKLKADESDQNHRWIVIVHGHGTNRSDPVFGSLSLVRELHQAGFAVLMFDLRASGQSSGNRGSAGYDEQRDLHGALDLLEHLGVAPKQVGILGYSMGGAIGLLVSSRSNRVASVVADSSFADLALMIKHGAAKRFKLLNVFMPGMRLAVRLLYGFDIGWISPVQALEASTRPVMLIHGELDSVVPMINFRMLSRVIEGGTGETWLVPDAGHIQSYRTHPEEYARRVVKFFERTLKFG